MSKEYKRLKNLDDKYNLHFADMAENLEEKYKKRREMKNDLNEEIDGIPREYKIYNIKKINSGGLYIRFGNNTIQDKINKIHHNIIN